MKCTDLIATYLTNIHCTKLFSDEFISVTATERMIGTDKYCREVSLGDFKEEHLDEIIEALVQTRKNRNYNRGCVAREIINDKKLGIENPKILYHDFKIVSTRLAKESTKI